MLVSLLVGFALGAFLLYIPARDALRQSQADLASTKSSLELAETKAEGMQSSLDSATSQLESAQSELKSSNLSLVISKLQENIGRARLALVSKDILTARQELSDADANLAELTLSLDDIETTSAMADRLKTIRTNITSDPSKALEEMRILGKSCPPREPLIQGKSGLIHLLRINPANGHILINNGEKPRPCQPARDRGFRARPPRRHRAAWYG